MTDPFGVTLTVIRPAPPAKHGNPGGPPTEPDIDGCVGWPAGSAENDNRGTVVEADYTYLLPPGSDITAADRVRLDDVVYEVVGTPQRWAPISASDGGVVVDLRTWGE